MGNSKYIEGKPILQGEYWHVEWKLRNGGTRITGFGYKDRRQAEEHITIVMSEYKTEDDE